MCFFLKGEILVSTHAYFQYSSSSYLATIVTLGSTSEVFELSHKYIPFTTGCGHRNSVYFSMLITWLSGRGDTMERNY